MIFYGVMKFDKNFASSIFVNFKKPQIIPKIIPQIIPDFPQIIVFSLFVNFKKSPHDILRGVEIVLNCPGLS